MEREELAAARKHGGAKTYRSAIQAVVRTFEVLEHVLLYPNTGHIRPSAR